MPDATYKKKFLDAKLLQTFSRVFKHLPQRRRKQFWILFFGMVVGAGLETLSLGVIAFFASAVSNPEKIMSSSYFAAFQDAIRLDFFHETKGVIVFLSILVTAILVLKHGTQLYVMYWARKFCAFVDGYIGQKLLEGFIRMPYEWFLSTNVADLILTIQFRFHFGRLFVFNVMQTLCDLLVVTFLLFTLFVVQPIISLIVILVVGGMAFFIYAYMRRIMDAALIKIEQYNFSINRYVSRALHGLKDVLISGDARYFLRDFNNEIYAMAQLEAKFNVITMVPKSILETLGFVMLSVAICVMLFYMEFSSVKIIGTITLLVVAAWRILPAVNRILSGFTQIRNSLPYVNRGLCHLDEIEKKTKNLSITHKNVVSQYLFNKNVQLKNVSFAYKGSVTPVLSNVNLHIDKGNTVGIIGPSGSGKSTLADILIGLLQPTTGDIRIDDKKLDNNLLAHWVQCIGYVPQTPYIYDGTLAENVAFGMRNSEIDRNKVQSCCQMASMQDFVNDLPNGVDTQLGERGTRLSGGQRQRVSIARALYRNPQVMIFDEATSSLDSKTEKSIQKTIYSFKGKLTLIIIAHRLSTVKECDFLIWIENGQVKMIDTPVNVLEIYS